MTGGAEQTDGFDTFLTNLWLVGLYTNITLPITDTLYIPAVLCVVATGLMWLRRPQTFPSLSFKAVLLFVGVLVASALLATGVQLHPFLSIAQFIVGISTAIIAYFHIVRLPSKKLSNILLGWLWFIVIGAMLEDNFHFFRQLSDDFRNFAYSGRFLYEGEVRDLLTYGGVRPKLFTQEPSHVAKMFLYASLGYLMLNRRFGNLLFIGAVTIAAAIFVRGPFVIVTIPAAIVAWLISGKFIELPPRIKVLYLGLTAATGLLAAATVFLIFEQAFKERLIRMAMGEDLSFSMRFVIPLALSFDVWLHHRWLGVGFGNLESMASEIFARIPLAKKDFLIRDPQTFISNSMFAIFIQFGVVGSILFLTAFFNVVKTLDKRLVILAAMVSAIVWNLDSGLTSARVCGYIVLILASATLFTEKRYATVDSPESSEL